MEEQLSPVMKAAVLEEFGSSPVLRSVEHPAPGPGEVVVRVDASGVNPLDIKIASGQPRRTPGSQPPMVLGMDLAGVVDRSGRRG